jgi:hemerythrin
MLSSGDNISFLSSSLMRLLGMTTKERTPAGKKLSAVTITGKKLEDRMGFLPFMWDNRYNTYVDEIDEQHQQLIKLIRKMRAVVENQFNQQIQSNVLDELLDYTHYHFNTEETLMVEHQYPFSEIHKRQHDEFTSRIHEFREDFCQGKVQAFRILGFLVNWLIDHILVSDKELGHYLNSKGIF